MTIKLHDHAFDRGRGDVRQAAHRLRTARDKADQRVTRCSSTPAGRASRPTPSSPLWDDWRVAAPHVEQGLVAMAELMDATQRDLHANDAASQAHLDAVACPHLLSARLMREPGDFVIEIDELDDVVGDLEACERDLDLLVTDLERQMVALHGTWEGLAATAQRETNQGVGAGHGGDARRPERPARRCPRGPPSLRRSRDHQRPHVASGHVRPTR